MRLALAVVLRGLRVHVSTIYLRPLTGLLQISHIAVLPYGLARLTDS